MLVYGECECFVMQMLYVCVLCASYGSSQCCVLHDFPDRMPLVAHRWKRQRTARDLSKRFSRGPAVAVTLELS